MTIWTEGFASEPDPPSRGTGPSELLPDEPYCDYCEQEGHTFRTCPRRDDDA